MRCVGASQRNWSRVGIGELMHPDGSTERVFLKQFTTGRRRWHPENLRYERRGAEVAEELLAGCVRIPRLRYVCDEHHVLAFELIEVTSFDILLREQETRFQLAFPRALDAITRCLERLATPFHLRESLPVKRRSYASGPPAVVFKGLDIRNVGLSPSGLEAEPEIVVFDFGRPYVAPAAEAAAKFLVSIGMLNWGKPTRRYLRGPDRRLWRLAAAHLDPYLAPEALQAEIDLQRSFRFREFHGGVLETTLKWLGVSTIGVLYMQRLQRLFDDLTRRVETPTTWMTPTASGR